MGTPLKERNEMMKLLAGFAAALALGVTSISAAAARWVHSPTGNIVCLVEKNSVACTMKSTQTHGHYTAWAIGNTGKTISRIQSGAVYALGRVVPYGQHFYSGGYLIRCVSRFSGWTCRNLSGHGFFLSREYQRTF